MDKNHSFAGKDTKSSILTISILLVLVCVVTFTLAFLFNDDFGSQSITLSGKVVIEAVGEGEEYKSIEDTTTSNLIIKLDEPYTVLIPGEDLEMYVNCKVYKSTTTPLLRARIDFQLTDYETGAVTEDSLKLTGELYSQLSDVIEQNQWYLHSDGYFYYIGDVDQQGATGGSTILKEIDATEDNAIVKFINEKIKFPEFVDSTYSGYGVTVVITFQAIQNFIPDEQGHKVDNTIDNSQKIFNFFENQDLETTSLRYFDIVDNTINLKDDIEVYPETMVLPKSDGENTITKIGTTFAGNHGIKKLIVPDSYTTIEEGAFANSDIGYVDLSTSKITEIPNNCFQNSSNLKTVLLPDGLITIGKNAFNYTALSSIVLPETVTTLKADCFTYTNLKVFYIPKSVKNIETPLIYSTYLQRITVSSENEDFKDSDGIMLLSSDGKTLLKAVYRLSNGDSLFIPEGVDTISKNALYEAMIDNVYIPSTTRTIETDALSSNTKHLYIDESNPYLDREALGAETP